MDWLDLLAVQGTLKSLLKGSLQPYGISLSKRVFVTLGSLQPYGLSPTRLLCPWNSPGKHTGEGCYALLQWTFGPRHQTHDSYISCIGRQILYYQHHLGSQKEKKSIVKSYILYDFNYLAY